MAEDGMIGSLADACRYVCEIVQPRPKGFITEDSGTIAKHEFPIYADFVKSFAFRSAWVCFIISLGVSFLFVCETWKLINFLTNQLPQYIIFTAATVTYITGTLNPSEVCKPDNTIMRNVQILHAPLKKIAFPGSFMGLCVSVLDELKIAVDQAIEHRSYDLDNAENEDDELVEERENLGRYLLMARKKLEEGGDVDMGMGMGMGLQRNNLREDRGGSDVMSRFRYWGFARLTNRIRECGW